MSEESQIESSTSYNTPFRKSTKTGKSNLCSEVRIGGLGSSALKRAWGGLLESWKYCYRSGCRLPDVFSLPKFIKTVC